MAFNKINNNPFTCYNWIQNNYHLLCIYKIHFTFLLVLAICIISYQQFPKSIRILKMKNKKEQKIIIIIMIIILCMQTIIQVDKILMKNLCSKPKINADKEAFTACGDVFNFSPPESYILY